MIYALGDRAPRCLGEHFIAGSADVIGDVVLGHNVSIWFNAVLRGDNEPITIGDNSNVQDGAVLHTELGSPLVIGAGVTIGHKAVVHGCRIGDDTLVGINAVILNEVRIGRCCLVGANTLIPERKEIPDFSLVMGSPGRVVRTLDEARVQSLRDSAKQYLDNLQRYRRDLRPVR
jgi:carbonic anhydrase/acetyltransferase-like protein (isoleucine patch superfamily)